MTSPQPPDRFAASADQEYLNLPSSASRQLLGRGSIFTVARLVQMAAALLVVPVVTRSMSTDQYGTVATATRVGQLLAALLALGLPAAITRTYFTDSGPERARRLGVSTFLVAMFAALAVHLTGPWWSGLFDSLTYEGPLVIVVWGAAALCVLESALGLLRAMGDVIAFVTAALVASVGGQVAGLAAIVITEGGPSTYLACVAAGSVAGALFGAWRSGMLGVLPATLRQLVAAIRLGGPTVPHLIALLLIATADRVVVERLLGLSEVARYELSYQVGSLALVLLTAANNAWAPLIFGAPEGERWQVLAETTSAIYKVMVPIVGLLALTGPIGLRLLAPQSYETAGLAPVMAVLAGASIIYVSYLANVHVIFQLWRTAALAWAAPLAAVVNIVLTVVLVSRWGLVGSSVATAVAFLVLAVIIGGATRRHVQVPWVRRDLFIAVGSTTVLVAVGSLLPDDNSSWLVARGALGAPMVVAVVAAVRNLGFRS